MSEYVLDSATDLGRQQLGHLERLLDEQTTSFIGAVAARPGHHCLDVGSGGGAVARWMAGRVAPTGSVVAVDVEDTHLDVPEDVTVYRHDINDGLPVAGPFDVVHTRLLLMHLARRREILAELAGALAPGGWLVVGDYVFSGDVRVLSAPSAADEELFRRIILTTIDQVGRPGGIDYGWGDEIDAELGTVGLSDVDTIEYAHTADGGRDGMLLYGNYIAQVEEPLRSLGVSDAELRRFQELVRDPRMRAWFFRFVCSRGRAT
ncbi:class I SAM-dependent methyltransferase [Aeromicrobium sp. CTD01-1L150]|uniref:class I SAM-dependent methyltransferase n=1 Tax=Aeromicrobium sp. CTD01-1L150 TaxID=3341830 RepID=UPI0035BFF002